MIIPNGTIEFKRKAGGGIDPETGYPQKPAPVSWGCPLPCQYSATKLNLLARANGEPATEAQYAILVEAQPVASEQVRLRDRCGKVVGEFSVKQVEPLDAVCQTRIWV